MSREVLAFWFVLAHHVFQFLLLVAQLLAQHPLLTHAPVHLVIADHRYREKNVKYNLKSDENIHGALTRNGSIQYRKN